ncbi:MAG: competence/damage-inducible protein A [Planctomycetota bacterium]|jgi:nicotinamide-nucleotide amidase
MKKANIVSIGNELLHGQGIDTNSCYIGEKLFSMGIEVTGIYSVGDKVDSIVQILDFALKESDLVFVTGGLGPTDDDVTRKALAAKLGVELVLDERLLEQMRKRFTRKGLSMPDTNRIQACIPKGARIMKNSIGTAPGMIVNVDGKTIFSMPGVPVEMKKMFEDSVLSELQEIIKPSEQSVVVLRKLKCFGVGESTIADRLGDMMQRGRNPEINSTASSGVITLHIISLSEDIKEAENMAEEDERKLRSILKELVYGSGEETLAEVVGRELSKRGKTLTVAESCTGGALVKNLTDVPGSSRYFKCGWTTYSNEAKVRQLGVDSGLIEREGAVSEAVAKAIAAGAKKNSGSNYSIGITGIAGPGGGSEQKPVGLVYICVDGEEGCEIKQFIFPYGRKAMRKRTVNTALNMLRLKLNG